MRLLLFLLLFLLLLLARPQLALVVVQSLLKRSRGLSLFLDWRLLLGGEAGAVLGLGEGQRRDRGSGGGGGEELSRRGRLESPQFEYLRGCNTVLYALYCTVLYLAACTVFGVGLY